MPIIIRPAQAADRQMIRRIVRRAKLYPFELNWKQFMVAQEDREIIAVGQIKIHHDGARELASVAVIPNYQKNGVGTALIKELIFKETVPIFLFCREDLQPFYERFGFKRMTQPQLPAVLSRRLWLANTLIRLISGLSGDQTNIAAMVRSVNIQPD